MRNVKNKEEQEKEKGLDESSSNPFYFWRARSDSNARPFGS